MKCFICGTAAVVHIVRGLKTASGPDGWGRICIPCAWEYDLDGQFLSSFHDPPEDSEASHEDKGRDG